MSILELLQQRPMTSRELQSQLNQSQTVVSRSIRKLGHRVVKLPSGRSPRYALTKNAFGSDDNIPIYIVDNYGNNSVVAKLRPLHIGGYLVEGQVGMPNVLLGQNMNGVFDGLPYFLQDLRPQGFIGRQIAADLAERSTEFPADPDSWNDNHVGMYLLSNGDDLPGNFQLGPFGFLRARKVPEYCDSSEYPSLANKVEAGEMPGSSAGGEQPKFTTFNTDGSGHAIVKFTSSENTPVSARWRDILISEYCALETLMEHTHIPAARTNIFHLENRTFLESTRFDRIGEFGRSSMLSLQSIDAEYVGNGTNWLESLVGLYQLELISEDHLLDVMVMYEFGRQINNTDMHLGNLSLGIEGSVFRLLPIYDMCSMGFAPIRERVKKMEFTRPNKFYDVGYEHMSIPAFDTAKLAANKFWKLIVEQSELSDEFRALAREQID